MSRPPQGDRTARAVYTPEQIAHDCADILSIDITTAGTWWGTRRRELLERAAAELFLRSEGYSDRAMRIRAALVATRTRGDLVEARMFRMHEAGWR